MAGALERLRFPDGSTRGRRFPEPPHPYRTEFQRDRDRIIHARAFRRLEDKTQVFTEPISDHFRNRLTHTIEVSQIARSAAAALGLNQDLTEALSLAHDFGHPPFGHAGEAELDRQMRRFGDRFEHNLHALRIVEHFEQRYARFPGLNLTFEVREGMVKHSRDLSPGENPELDEYLPGIRPPIEAQLIDLADEIAYNTADLDDGYGAGLLTMDDASDAVPLYAEMRETIETRFPGAPERVRFLEILSALTNHLVTGLIEGTVAAAEEAGAETHEDVRHCPRRLAGFTPESAAANAALKILLAERVYRSPKLTREREKSVPLIGELFDYYAADIRRLPEPYATRAVGDAPHRVICDYIAGMTDGYLLRTVRRISTCGRT